MTTQTVGSAVAQREAGIVNVMWGRKTHFAAVLPDHIDVKSFLGTAAAALYADEKLMQAATRNPDSLVAALMRSAALGHQPGTDEFYLTIRKGAVLGIEGYRGIIERMYRSGAVATVVVREVCQNDQFEYIEGQHDKPIHQVNWFGGGRGDMIGVYAYAVLTTGAVSRVVILSRDDVMAAKAASDAGGSSFSPWNRADGGPDHPEFTGRSMWWKTAARRLEPWVPTSAEYRREQLRASAAASDLTARPPAPIPPAGPEEVVDAEIVDEQTASPATPAPRAPEPQQTPPAEQVAGEAPDERVPLATSGQVGIIRAHFQRLGYTDDDRDARLRRTAQLARVDDLSTTKELDQDQARRVIEALKSCKSIDDLDALLSDGEVPGDE